MEQIQENEQWKLNGNCEKCNFSGNKDENIVIFLGDFGLVWNVEKVKLLKEICDKSNAKFDISRSKCKNGTGRAAEVNKWINEHEVDSFVILDDEDWNWSDYGYENNWIQPTWSGNGGLKREHVDKAIEILNQRK